MSQFPLDFFSKVNWEIVLTNFCEGEKEEGILLRNGISPLVSSASLRGHWHLFPNDWVIFILSNTHRQVLWGYIKVRCSRVSVPEMGPLAGDCKKLVIPFTMGPQTLPLGALMSQNFHKCFISFISHKQITVFSILGAQWLLSLAHMAWSLAFPSTTTCSCSRCPDSYPVLQGTMFFLLCTGYVFCLDPSFLLPFLKVWPTPWPWAWAELFQEGRVSTQPPPCTDFSLCLSHSSSNYRNSVMTLSP